MNIDEEEVYPYVVALARQAPDHLPSPLIDVLNRRKTEIDALNGAVVKKACEYGIEVPYNTAIYNLIAIIENHHREYVR